MIQVLVGSKSQAHNLLLWHDATHWISLVDHNDTHPQMPGLDHLPRLLLNCDDQMDATDPHAPTRDQVQQILDFTRDLSDATIVVNCFAGISRSTAAALAVLVQHHGSVHLAIDLLRSIRPMAMPNPVICQFADDILGLNGSLFAASEKMAKTRVLDIINGDDDF
jgi:predicted protein tyrosine phosphatase